MHHMEKDGRLMVIVERGEKLVSTLTEVLIQKNLRGGFISGGVEWNAGPQVHTVTIMSPVNALTGTNPDGSVVRVRDVGRAELGTELPDVKVKFDGKPAAGLTVTVVPGGKRYRNDDGAREFATAVTTPVTPGPAVTTHTPQARFPTPIVSALIRNTAARVPTGRDLRFSFTDFLAPLIESSFV